MSLFTSPLLESSPQAWLDAVFADWPGFMQDHASCERKAAALALSFVAKYPDRVALIDPMVSLAREELEHFAQVFRIMRKRGIPLSGVDERDGYVNEMIAQLRHGREERFLDRLILSGLIEARGYERFHMLAEALRLGDVRLSPDPNGDSRTSPEAELAEFYRSLADREAGHYKIFEQMAELYFSENEVKEALTRIAAIEAQAMRAAPLRARLH